MFYTFLILALCCAASIYKLFRTRNQQSVPVVSLCKRVGLLVLVVVIGYYCTAQSTPQDASFDDLISDMPITPGPMPDNTPTPGSAPPKDALPIIKTTPPPCVAKGSVTIDV